MFGLLLAIIYLAFISLGLPDSLLGSAWPVMYNQLDVPMSFAGIVTMLIAGGTIVSSLMSDKLTRKLGAGLVTAISVLMTAVALFGFSISKSFIIICIWAIPYGLGAGAVDAALNNYVALHYKARHMSWLHCFWGVGAAISPYIMSFSLSGGYGWATGYKVVGLIQVILTAFIFLSLPIWKKRTTEISSDKHSDKAKTLPEIFKIKGVPLVLLTFFSYCALESTTGLWASSYLVKYRSINFDTAASFGSLFFLGITFGRFLCGFVSEKLGDKVLIRFGILTACFGVVLVAIPISNNILALLGLLIIGFGCAPIYPSIIHATPSNFGKENSQAIIGVQMASAYTGSTFMPPLFGLIAGSISIALYPYFLIIFAFLMLITSEKLNKLMIK